ncbi:MAG: hypothetical protein C5B60_01775 [Chloroflexi bacterium]|nr:MAG: hypothetical protein C5B60_01775 [Chloroflexota bacterium]
MAHAGSFRFPGGDARTTVLGRTGSGKSTCGLWLLSHQRLDKRPWVCIDFKREIIFDQVGFPPIQQIRLADKLPKRPGLYLVSPRPGQEVALEAFLWRLWQRENIGVYVDEAALMPDGDAFPALLQQGRSKRIPVIACSQRPVSVARGLFSEANFFAVYHMVDKRDYRIVEGFAPAELSRPLPAFAWYWYDVQRDSLLAMAPVPRPEVVADGLRERIPYRANDWHPFRWTSRPTGRLKIAA